jgi:hypothetical protein
MHKTVLLLVMFLVVVLPTEAIDNLVGDGDGEPGCEAVSYTVAPPDARFKPTCVGHPPEG